MTTAAMMRASTATNAPATAVVGSALATVGGVVLVDVLVEDAVVGSVVVGTSVSKGEHNYV